MVVVVSSCFIHLWGNDNIWKHDSNYMMGLWYIYIYYIYNGNIMGIQCYNGNIMVHYMNYGYIMGINHKATYDWEDYTGWEPINMGMDSTLSENIVWRSWPNIRSFSLPSFGPPIETLISSCKSDTPKFHGFQIHLLYGNGQKKTVYLTVTTCYNPQCRRTLWMILQVVRH